MSGLKKDIEEFKRGNNEVFLDVLNRFTSYIKLCSYKLNYYCAETDLIIYLFKLIPQIDLSNFESDKYIIGYIKKCIRNMAVTLYKKNKNYSFITYDNDVLDNNIAYIQEFPIDVEGLISNLSDTQKKIIIYRYKYRFSDSEIGKLLKISRQAVYKNRAKALAQLKYA
ncbi:sigma-70 family RNA polymerase sigma factor [Clostridium intestinale]|uniref:BotR n=1 Tax=Clostridium intestinale URNW TaxID=1294142 RepID=U2PYU2_9CLOT|nr:sigma-70 family RNA polymerase sigma factor [Clostridium intestinale]ERK28954.1 BotR [Clostridium intestinale URNW]